MNTGRTPDGAQQHEEDEEEPHGQAQADQLPVVILHAVTHVADEVKLGACTRSTFDVANIL